METAVENQAERNSVTDIGLQLQGKYLTFKLGEEEFGLQILKVHQIIQMPAITKVPRTPDFVRGVINLRGKVIPAIELRTKFEMGSCADTEKTCIIVVQVDSPSGTIIMGIVIDEVKEVLEIEAGAIEETPKMGTQVDADFILGMAKVGSSVKMLIDIDSILSTGELQSLAHISQ